VLGKVTFICKYALLFIGRNGSFENEEQNKHRSITAKSS